MEEVVETDSCLTPEMDSSLNPSISGDFLASNISFPVDARKMFNPLSLLHLLLSANVSAV
jgi:hypothetical protein